MDLTTTLSINKAIERSIWDSWNLASDEEREGPSQFVARMIKEFRLPHSVTPTIEAIIAIRARTSS